MKLRKATNKEVRAFVDEMTECFCLKPAQIEGCRHAAVLVQTAPRVPLDIFAMHRVLVADPKVGGVYRQGPVLDMSGQVKVYPKSSSVEKLTNMFLPVYERMLKAPPRGEFPAQSAWQTGALFRFIHPFIQGNSILGILIEHHLMQWYGLQWRTLRPKDEFYFICNNTFIPALAGVC